MQMEGVVWGLIGIGDVIDNEAGNSERETKPLPQPLSEERGEQLAVKMEEVILGLIWGGDDIDQ